MDGPQETYAPPHVPKTHKQRQEAVRVQGMWQGIRHVNQLQGPSERPLGPEASQVPRLSSRVCQQCHHARPSEGGSQGNQKKMRKQTNNIKVTCKECGKRFTTSVPFKDHLNIHLGLKPHKCPLCFQGFASKATMHGHLRGVHKGLKRK